MLTNFFEFGAPQFLLKKVNFICRLIATITNSCRSIFKSTAFRTVHHAKPEENPHFSRNSPSLFIFLVWVGSCNPTQAFLVFRSATTIALCFTNWTPGKSLSITTYEGRILLLTCSTISPWSVRYGTGVELCRQSCVCDMCWKKQYSFCERAGREDWRHAEKGNGILYGLVPSRFSTRKREVLVPRNLVSV